MDLRGLTPWVDSMDDGEVNLVYVDGTQDDEAIVEASKLEEPLHFKTTSTGIVVRHDVKDYPDVLADWYIETRMSKPMWRRRIGGTWM